MLSLASVFAVSDVVWLWIAHSIEVSDGLFVHVLSMLRLHCFDTVGWAAGRASCL